MELRLLVGIRPAMGRDEAGSVDKASREDKTFLITL